MNEQIPWDEFSKNSREHGKIKRAKNRDFSAKILKEKGVNFVSRNDGAHLIIDGAIDFWPGTGLWKFRTNDRTGRGVYVLLRQMGLG